MIIKKIIGREILDSRGNPTVEAEVILNNNTKAIAMVPSGASTGSLEACELRDNDPKRYFGKGVLKAVANINNIINKNLQGKSVESQKDIDLLLNNLDGTENKAKLGANAILAVSLACAKAAAEFENINLYQYLASIYWGESKFILSSIPIPMMNIINGGAHADNKLDIQEFMIVPKSGNFAENLRYGVEVFHSLKKLLKQASLNTAVGDEGGFAPNFRSNIEAIDYILEAITITGLAVGKDINLALDVAGTELYNNNYYNLGSENKNLSTVEFVDYLSNLVKQYPIISIEDGLAENDWHGWQLLTEKLGSKIQIVGDDLFVTNCKLLQKGIDQHAANAILIKLNQIGTLTETFAAIKLGQQNNYNIIISHRSGETEDAFIADLAVAVKANYIKTGSVCRSERVAKYNRLLRINNYK